MAFCSVMHHLLKLFKGKRVVYTLAHSNQRLLQFSLVDHVLAEDADLQYYKSSEWCTSDKMQCMGMQPRERTLIRVLEFPH